ncbi:hypothetical protein INR49_010524 [Caranx melampygus]|nr:hypothetical protein INR49_010524 [Caranx melampygus]
MESSAPGKGRFALCEKDYFSQGTRAARRLGYKGAAKTEGTQGSLFCIVKKNLKKLNMDFLEGSRGIYRPIRVALMMALLRLQQEDQIPSWVTAEDMIQLILEKSKSTLRERLWEFELEGFDEDEAMPLLTLLWAVNVSNKMRDVEFEARMLLKSPEAVPPNFQHHKVLSVAQDYAKILRDLEAPGSKLVHPREMVIEVVPRVLQGFWALPPQALLNMPSQLLSKLSVGVAKATLDRLCNALTTVGCQANFTRSIRDDMVLSILTEIRQTWPHDILVSSIRNFSPVLLTEIADVAVRHICEMFEPRSPELLAPLKAEVQTISEEQQISSPEINSAVVESPLVFPAEPAAKIQVREDSSAESSLDLDPKPSSEADSATLTNQLSPPAEPAAENQAREDGKDEATLEMDNSTELDTFAAVTPLLSSPAEPAAEVLDGNRGPNLEMDNSTELDTFAAVTPLLSSPAEPAAEVLDDNRGPSLEIDNSTELDTFAVVKPLSSSPAEPAAEVLDDNRGPSLEMDNSTELDTFAAVTPLLSSPAEPAAEVLDDNRGPSLEMDNSTELDTFAAVTPLLSSPAEPATEDQAREDGSGGPNLEIDPSTELDTFAVVTLPLSQPVEHTVKVPSPDMEPNVTTTADSVVVTPPAEPASKVQAKEELTEEDCQIECHAAVNAFKISLPVIKGLSCEHAHPQPSCLRVVVSAQPQCPPLVEVDGVLSLQEVCCAYS